MPFTNPGVPGAPAGADSLSIGGNVTAPAAGAAIATLAAPPAGVYEVRVAAAVGAGAVAADNGNVQLKKGAAVHTANLPTTGTEQVIDRVTLDGATAVTLNAVGVGTAAVVYTGRITATRVE
jgi:hypothetical protein